MSTHSVAHHLSVNPVDYDAEIRRFVPGYEEMLDELCDWLARLVPPTAKVLELGAGTGALAARIAERMPAAQLTLLDIDPRMLEVARSRGLHSARLLHQSFADMLPSTDATVASLALHHVPEPADKLALYRRIRAASKGPLLVADAYVDIDGRLATEVRRAWAAHLVACGDSEAEAYARFADWAREDRYHPLVDELRWLREAGFGEVDAVWRKGPVAVVVAI